MTLHCKAKPFRAAPAFLAGLCGLGMLALQACATTDMPQPKYPIYMQDKPAEAAPSPAPIGAETQAPVDTSPAIAAPQSNGAISSTDLPPPPPPPPPADEVSAPTPTGTVTQAPPRPAATPVSAPVRDTGAAYVYVMETHDTLYGVSRRFGVPVKQLFDINDLTADSALRVGQRILLPASAVDKGPEAHCNGAGMTPLKTAIAATTPAPKPTPARTEPARVVTTIATAPSKAAVTTPPKPVETASVTPPPVVQTTKPAVTAPPPADQPVKPASAVAAAPPPANGAFPNNSQISSMGRGMFVWPVRGKIIVPFGQLAPNVRNDGINIQAGEGTEVLAAADGVVVYEGDQVKELGNTIYVKHAGGWYTGYSHLAEMNVKNNEKVTKGEVIGTVGQTGVIDRPQLHFEIRYTPSTDIAKPVDPNLVLP